MQWPSIVITAGLLGATLGLTRSADARADGPRAGAAVVAITPPKGTPMAGYYHERGAAGNS